MSDCGVSIFSDNLSGLTANVTFYPCSGGTINLGDQVFPFTYVTDYWYGSYDCYVPTYAYNYILSVPCPSATPSSTPTPTPTATPIITQTTTPTETSTPTQSPTNTETPTNTPTNTETPTNTPTNTETPTPTNTPTNTETPTNTPTNTETPTSTATPTPTLTQTPTSINYQFQLGYGSFPNEACSATETSFYGTRSGGPTIEVTEILYTNDTVTTPVPDGYYSDGTILYIVSGGSGEVTAKYNYGCLNLATPTPTVTQTSTNTPTPTNTETPTPTQTPTSSETPTPTQTQTPTNTETPTNTPSNTPTNTETPTQTQTPTVTSSNTPTPTPTQLRFQFLVFSGTNYIDSCAQLYNAVIYGDSPSFTSNTQFYNNIRGTVSINMSGFYALNTTVTQLNSSGTQVGSYFSCV